MKDNYTISYVSARVSSFAK